MSIDLPCLVYVLKQETRNYSLIHFILIDFTPSWKRKKKKRKKAFWNQRILKRRLCILVWTENILKTEALRKRWVYDNHELFPYPRFTQTQIQKGPVIVVSKSSDVVWNIWCVFRVKPPFSNSSGPVWKDTNMYDSRTHPNTCLSIHSLFCN